jgi:hypothetical protein
MSDLQACYRPTPDTWSVNEKLEHLVLAEVSGCEQIWSAAEGMRKDKPVWTGEHTNGLSIEEIIACTWKPKETAPSIATPHLGGPLSYWLESPRLAQQLLDRLGPVLDRLNLESVIFPHFLCGPLDPSRRIRFLTFHLARHRLQIEEMMARADLIRFTSSKCFPQQARIHPLCM